MYISRESNHRRRMAQYLIYHKQGNKYVGVNPLMTGLAPSYGSELIFSESCEGNHFELTPGKWSHIKHVKSGMYVTLRADNNTLMLAHQEPDPNDDLFKYKKGKQLIKCKVPKRRKPKEFRRFWYGENPGQHALVEVRQVSDKVPTPREPYTFILKK